MKTEAVEAVQAAAARLKGYVRNTPVRRAFHPSKVCGGGVFLKLEHLQHTGSFKVRGALNKLLPLKGSGQHIVAASTGNHALAVAHACQIAGLACTLYLPISAQPHKVAALKRYPATLRFVAGDAVEAEYAARRAARATGCVFVSPYNDMEVIGGQGTVGTELLSQVRALDYVLMAVGGGGLISGVASAVKALSPGTRVIGCSPEASPVMHQSVRAGAVVHAPSQPTLSDGTAGGLESGTITLPLCTLLVDDWVLVSERAIAQGLRWLYDHESLVVEGAAGVAVAGLTKSARRFAQCRVAVVLCGGNINQDTFHKTIQDVQ